MFIGSHDSTTYTLKKNSEISPDARPPIQSLKFLRFLLAPFLLKWSQTQCVNIVNQLNYGIRYFDLRVAKRNHQQEYYFVHNLYGGSVRGILEEIVRFLEDHPLELVILDFQHFFGLDKNDHASFRNFLKDIFNTKLLPYNSSMADLSLNNVTNTLRKQILVIYRHKSVKHDSMFWPADSCQTPWPDTVVGSALVTFLNNGIKLRNNTVCFVSQFVLTPTVWYAFRHILGSLKNRCVLPIEKIKYRWLDNQKPGNGGLNIVISDFIDEQDFLFCKKVVALNDKIVNEVN